MKKLCALAAATAVFILIGVLYIIISISAKTYTSWRKYPENFSRDLYRPIKAEIKLVDTESYTIANEHLLYADNHLLSDIEYSQLCSDANKKSKHYFLIRSVVDVNSIENVSVLASQNNHSIVILYNGLGMSDSARNTPIIIGIDFLPSAFFTFEHYAQ